MADTRGSAADSWLDRPLSDTWCVLGWIGSTALFICLMRALGGPTSGDAAESLYSTWVIAHGQFTCAFGPWTIPVIAPLYPLLSGGISALAGIGHGVPFPSAAHFGAHCTSALAALNTWWPRTDAVSSTDRIGYLCWIPLAAGLVALLRSCGRGRCGWEPVTLFIVAVAPPVMMPVESYFHPQDLLAMGLALGSLAAARRGSWIVTGVLIGLAFTSQQFALLLAIPLLVASPRGRRLRFILGTAAATLLVVAPLIWVTSGHVIKSAFIGSGDTPSVGGTVIWEASHEQWFAFAASRVVPLVLAALLALWARSRLGSAIIDPVPLISIVATSLTFRLIFEQNLFGYYFMAVAVMLIVLDVVAGSIRWPLVAWLVLVAIAFPPAPWENEPWSQVAPRWLDQLVLVVVAVVLAVTPLLASIRRGAASDSILVRGP